MNVLGIYIFNETRNTWLQDDRRSWGSFADAAEFQDADFAERLREEVSADDVTFTMAALH